MQYILYCFIDLLSRCTCIICIAADCMSDMSTLFVYGFSISSSICRHACDFIVCNWHVKQLSELTTHIVHSNCDKVSNCCADLRTCLCVCGQSWAPCLVRSTRSRIACGTCPFCLHCVTPMVLTPLRCEIPRCHGCACYLLVCVRDLCAQATKSS